MTNGEASPDISSISISSIDFAGVRSALDRLAAWRKAWRGKDGGTAAPYEDPLPGALSSEEVRERFEQEIEDPDRRSWLIERMPHWAAGHGAPIIGLWEEGLLDRDPLASRRDTLAGAVENILAAEACAELRPALRPLKGPKTSVPTSLRKSTLLRDGATCQLCGRGFPLPLHAYAAIRKAARRGSLLDGLKGKERRRAEMWYRTRSRPPCADHIIPQVWGGPDALWNLWTLCYLCNYWKGSRFIPELVRLALYRLEAGDPDAPHSEVLHLEAPAADRIRKAIERARERTRALRER